MRADEQGEGKQGKDILFRTEDLEQTTQGKIPLALHNT